MTHPRVILVSPSDRPIGSAPKLLVHRRGWLHRAVSVFLFDGRGRMLLQRRARAKYHSPGLWSNTCCGHPVPGEAARAAATRRLREEMGLEAPLTRITEFTYWAEVGSGLIEHEYDHLFVGRCDAVPHPDPSEVADWGWQSPAALEQAIRRRPSRFTAWLPFALSAWRRASRTASRTELVRRCS